MQKRNRDWFRIKHRKNNLKKKKKKKKIAIEEFVNWKRKIPQEVENKIT